MIYNIKGELTYAEPQFAVVECGGIGFKCFTSLTTIKSLGKTGSTVNLYTYLSVKEDAMDLFGFATLEELNSFKLLITVSGVGPKAAVSVLSELTPDRLALAIASSDVKAITKASGVGKKTAERIVLELKDKTGSLSGEDLSSIASASSAAEDSAAGEAVAALVALGFGQSDAAAAVGKMDQSLSADEMIRLGLRQLSSKL